VCARACVCVCERERERERKRESVYTRTHTHTHTLTHTHTHTIHTDGAVGGGAGVRDVDEEYLEKGVGMAVEDAVVEQVVDGISLDPALAHAEAASGLWSRQFDRLRNSEKSVSRYIYYIKPLEATFENV
jgi:hypothetical protein